MTLSKTILLRSGWQWVNIGDIAHTPGMLRLLETHLPEHQVILWHNQLGRRTEAMLKRHFPRLRFLLAHGVETLPREIGREAMEAENKFVQDELPRVAHVEDENRAMESADFCLHGSGPSLVGEKQIQRWHDRTSKPFGAIGITVQSPSPQTASLLDQAQFVFSRETHSLEHMKRAGIKSPHLEFAPDATFACDLRDDASANAYLQKVGLAGKKFICVIPRSRRSPYHKIYPHPPWSAQSIAELEALNAKYAEPDHAKLREVMVRYVRATGGSVLVCPEMEYQLAIQRPLLIDPLPADVKKHVINRDTYWLNDEATSVYRQSQGLIGYECHSPILCAVQGVPGFYVRHPEDTIKGQMYYDLGLEDRIAEAMQIEGPELADRFMKLIDDPAAASSKLARAMQIARGAHERAMSMLKEALAGTTLTSRK